MSKSGRLKEWIQKTTQKLHQFVDRVWYPPFIGILAGLDNFILVIPNDGILISSSMLAPRRWFSLAVNVAIGSTIGAVLFYFAVKHFGLPFILDIYTGMDESQVWIWAVKYFDQYGLYLVFLIAASPLIQQPTVILASMAHIPVLQLTLAIFIGRFLKFLVMAYIGSHAPRLLSKMWGVKGELKDVGIKVK